MVDVLTLALAAVLGASAAVVGGLAVKGAHSFLDAHFAKIKAREARKMPRDTEAAQGAGTTVITPGVGLIQFVNSTPTTEVANAEVPEPTKSYSASTVLISPKLQVSQPTHDA
ncbi:MAG: hypothetical protein ACREJ6_01475 [Candidatus Methylomirabilis sp.]